MGLKLDGCACVETIDSSGELLIVENHDISDLEEGRGVVNWEHSGKAEDIIGAVIYARKILNRSDCLDDRQRKYWDIVKKPLVYIIAELFDDDEVAHPAAVAVAAMVRYYAKRGEKLLTAWSIEGATLERDDYILKESVGRRVACTLRPCNKTAIAGLLEDPKAKKIAKYVQKISRDIDSAISEIEIDSVILEDAFVPQDPVLELHKAIEDLNKTLTGGMYGAAPSQLTGNAALAKEYISGFQRNRVKAAIRDWDRRRPLSETIKAALPEVSDDYIHHFVNLAQDLALKKALPQVKLTRLGSEHSPNHLQSDEQKKLVDGIYVDPKKFDMAGKSFASGITRHVNDAGSDVLVKKPMRGNTAKRATQYYHLAEDFFGMGDHVPVTNYVKAPGYQTSVLDPSDEPFHQVMEHIKGSKTPLTESPERVDKALDRAKSHGDLDKLMIMDTVLGNSDRHEGNSLIHPKGHVMSIDNDYAFSLPDTIKPWYLNGREEQAMHPEASGWLRGLDPKKLVGIMADQGHDSDTIKRTVAGLRKFQQVADRPMTSGHMNDIVRGHMVAVDNESKAKARSKQVV